MKELIFTYLDNNAKLKQVSNFRTVVSKHATIMELRVVFSLDFLLLADYLNEWLKLRRERISV